MTIPGWTQTLANWQQRDARDALTATAEAIYAAIEATPPHPAILQALLALPPLSKPIEEGLLYFDRIWALDSVEAELALELWRAEVTA